MAHRSNCISCRHSYFFSRLANYCRWYPVDSWARDFLPSAFFKDVFNSAQFDCFFKEDIGRLGKSFFSLVKSISIGGKVYCRRISNEFLAFFEEYYSQFCFNFIHILIPPHYLWLYCSRLSVHFKYTLLKNECQGGEESLRKKGIKVGVKIRF